MAKFKKGGNMYPRQIDVIFEVHILSTKKIEVRNASRDDYVLLRPSKSVINKIGVMNKELKIKELVINAVYQVKAEDILLETESSTGRGLIHADVIMHKATKKNLVNMTVRKYGTGTSTEMSQMGDIVLKYTDIIKEI